MVKKTWIALLLASQTAWAIEQPTNNPKADKTAKSYTDTELSALKNDWLNIYQKELQLAEQLRAKQRENFVQVMKLINSAQAQKTLSDPTAQLIQGLLTSLSGYALEREADWAWLNAKAALNQASQQDFQAFGTKYPNSPYQKALQQLPFAQLYAEQKFADLVEYSKTVKPASVADQCRLLSARFELAANQAQLNPEASSPTQSQTQNGELAALLNEFDTFWLANAKLTPDCANLEAFGRDQGRKTDEIVRQKALELVKQNASAELNTLALNSTNEALKAWLTAVATVVANPSNLQNFVENQPLESPFKAENRALIVQLFPAYLRTLAENMPNPTFAPYQQWAEQYQLSPDELNGWKTAFLSRFFDNSEPTFQLWRDEQLKNLKADNLIERRLRMAIGQKAGLGEWLEQLSCEGKAKAEWRYWAAKAEKNDAAQKTVFEALAKERGFYPMLAAQQLGVAYQLSLPAVRALTAVENQQYQREFDRITELRALGRMGQAKSVWGAFIKSLAPDATAPTELQLAVIHYANTQHWADLAVEGTILLKAFDNLDLRLPDAYADWFGLNLKDKKISKTFAQAIARQESAWNAQAKSSANAMGLMQMLPSTAQKTAKENGLPYSSEADLFDPFNNIMLGTAHLAELNEKFPNNRILIAAAYNAGAGRVAQWLARSNGTLAMDEFIATIPFLETRGYVQNVLAYDYYYQALYGEAQATKTAPKMFTSAELSQKY